MAKAVSNGSLADIWTSHHDPTMAANHPRMKQPSPFRDRKGGGVTYIPPGSTFQQVASDCFHQMHVLLVSLVQYGLSLPCWFWDTLLVTELMKHGPLSQEERNLAMLDCLVQSSATMD